MPIEEKARRASAPVRDSLKEVGLPAPRWGLVLGSGLDPTLSGDPGSVSMRWRFEELPGLRPTTVPGHPGTFEYRFIEGAPVLLQRGRIHYYETRDLRSVCLPVLLMRDLGVGSLLLTNAAGGLNPSFHVGEFMLVRDHIDLIGAGLLWELMPAGADIGFPDLSGTYDRDFGDRLLSLAGGCGVRLREGVLVAVPGPAYETPAEARYLRIIGGDAVSMSLVPEAICAHLWGMRVAALSCITNVHPPPAGIPLTHDEVLKAAGRSAAALERLLRSLISTEGSA